VVTDEQLPVCRRCGRPVRVGMDNYEMFERMHYVCFHYEEFLFWDNQTFYQQIGLA
jgi:hypothetical protein